MRAFLLLPIIVFLFAQKATGAGFGHTTVAKILQHGSPTDKRNLGGFAHRGRNLASWCSYGKFLNKNGNWCQMCNAGRYQPYSRWSQSFCLPCLNGKTYQMEKGKTNCNQCSGCGSGRYISQHCRTDHSTICGICNPGTFQDETGKGNCKTCPNGYYQPESDQGSCNTCSNCAAGQYVSQSCDSDSDTICEQCTQGQYMDETAQETSCKACPQGRYDRSGRASCNTCSNCAGGEYVSQSCNSNSNTVCNTCEAGKRSPASNNNLIEAPCVGCLSGQYSNAQRDACVDCPKGYSQSQGLSISCVQCPGGRYSDQTGRITCEGCSTGKYSTQVAQITETSCIPCTGFQYTDEEGLTACKTCTSQEVINSGHTGCDRMCSCDFGERGTQCTTEQPESCVKCLPNYGLNDDGICALCGANYQSAASGLQCEPCPNGQGALPSQPCTTCPAGRTSTSGSGCYPICGVGQYAKNIGVGDFRCDPCEAGKYSNTDGGHSCTECPVGYFQKEAGGVECQSCGERSYSDTPGQTNCKDCPLGTGIGQTGIANILNCHGCDEHTVYNNNTEACQRCPIGKHSPTTSDTCEPCPAGQTSESGHACQPCPVGTFADSNICQPCRPGTTSDQGSTSTADCRVATSTVCSYYADLDCEQLDLAFDEKCTQTCDGPSSMCPFLRNEFVDKKCQNQRVFSTV